MTDFSIYGDSKREQEQGKRFEEERMRRIQEQGMNLAEFLHELAMLAQLLEADGRDLTCVNITFGNKIIRKIELEDDGSQMDNLDVVIK